MQLRLLSLIATYLFQGSGAFNLHHVLPAPSVDLEVSSLNSASEATRSKFSGLEPLENTHREELEDVEITNDSDESRGGLDINGLELTLRPTSVALSSNQTSLLVLTMETFLLNQFSTNITNSSLSLISAVEFNDDVKTDFIPARRMLRNGRYLPDAETVAYSVMKIFGGSANYTWNLYYGEDYPTEDELNAAILSILTDNMSAIMQSVPGLESVTDVEVRPYNIPSVLLAPDKIAPDEETKGSGVGGALSATFGCLAAVIVACVIAYQSRKKDSFKRIGSRYREVRSNLRMRSLKREGSRDQDGEYLVEICTDLAVEDTPKPEASPKVQSPSSVKGQKLRVEERKTIDPSDYVVEIGTDEIAY
jgi:hypothetical protein